MESARTPWPREQWLDALWESQTLTPNEWAVAYCYARYAGREDIAWATYDEIMRRTGMRSRRTVSQTIAKLRSAGWLAEVSRAGQHRSPVYRLTCPLQQSQIATAGAEKPPSVGQELAEPVDGLGQEALASPASSSKLLPSAVAILHASSSNPGTPDLRYTSQIEISDIAALPRGHAPSGRAPTRRKNKASHTDITEAAQIIYNDPVIEIDWTDAIAFARWIGHSYTSKPITDLAAYVQKLSDAHALASVLSAYQRRFESA